MSKHTPGPWVAIHSDTLWEVKSAREDETEETINKYSPAPAYAWDVGDGTAEANARLIAAAPDLLEALLLCKFDSLNMSLADLEFCRAAIAKATGETT